MVTSKPTSQHRHRSMARAWSGVGGAAEAPERKLSVIAVRLLKNCPSSFNLAYFLFGRLLPVTSRRGLDKYSNQNVKHLLRRAVHLVGRVVSASIVTNSISNAGSLVELMPHANYVACLLAARFHFHPSIARDHLAPPRHSGGVATTDPTTLETTTRSVHEHGL
jgi:hypothetical protein